MFVDPSTKMPTTHYERQENSYRRTVKSSPEDCDLFKAKEFYMSIPDYQDINHLSEEEFYKMLKDLRQKKRKLLGLSLSVMNGTEDVQLTTDLYVESCANKGSCNSLKPTSPVHAKEVEKTFESKEDVKDAKTSPSHDRVRFSDPEDDVDKNFKRFFSAGDMERSWRSMPSSPLKSRRSSSSGSIEKKRSTSVKPFKMTIRDEDSRRWKSLKQQTKFWSEEMVDRKVEKQRFRANPVPIESRIPLYDKILEDQAMRSAITKLNSAAELQSQMRPFKFTLRDEFKPKFPCSKLDPPPEVLESRSNNKNKLFKARPVPKNLFSNYVPEKIREEEYFRAMNRRIRAEELLKCSSLPPSMAARSKSAQRTRGSTPACAFHSNIPSDNTSDLSSHNDNKSRKKCRTRSRMKSSAEMRGGPYNQLKHQGKLPSAKTSTERLGKTMPCTLEDRASCRPNLAALLRLETTKKRIEEELERRRNEREYKAELKWRDHILRKKPAWDMVRNNCREDIALRLQTRRDEDRLLREQFQHQMELMHDRVKEQPLLFERFYYPIKKSKDCSPRKSALRNKSGSSYGNLSGSYTRNSPTRERKVSINETADTINEDLAKYLNSCAEEDHGAADGSDVESILSDKK